MFKELKTLLVNCSAVSITLTASGEMLKVTVIPKPKATGDNAGGLNTPLQLSGSAEELYQQFATLVAVYSSSHASLAEQVAAVKAVLDAAKQTVTKAGVKATNKAADKASTTVAPGTGTDDEGEDDDDGVGQTATPAAAPAAVSIGNLFD